MRKRERNRDRDGQGGRDRDREKERERDRKGKQRQPTKNIRRGGGILFAAIIGHEFREKKIILDIERETKRKIETQTDRKR